MSVDIFPGITYGWVIYFLVVNLCILIITGKQFFPNVVTIAVLIAMPVVARSRFSTGTIGRDHLIGRPGAAVTLLDPEGVVEVDGARWRARAHREAGLTPGDAVVVTAIHGLELEVDPVPESTE